MTPTTPDHEARRGVSGVGNSPPAVTVTIRCSDYRAHQLTHRRIEGAWVCETCRSRDLAHLHVPKDLARVANATPEPRPVAPR